MRFDSCHPAVNFLFFTVVIAAAVCFDHPAFLLTGWLCAWIFAVCLEGRRAAGLGAGLLLPAAAFALYYACYHHFGVTELTRNFIGNRITLESLIYGAVLGIKAVTVIGWFVCVHSVVSSDKIIYLFGRVWPKLSLLLAILLRTVPRVRIRAGKVEEAQRCIGRSVKQGTLWQRIGRFFREASVVVTWTLDDFITSSDSMKSRGYSLRGRTAFSIYRFDDRDRLFVIALFTGFTAMAAAVILDQTRTAYAPEIRINPVSKLSILFYAAYAAVCLLPVFLQTAGEIRFRRLRKKSGTA